MKLTEKLKPCPFCGGEATFLHGSAYYTHTVAVRCAKCHAHTVAITFGDNGTLNPKYYSRDGEKSARDKVLELWNSRNEV